uniref:Uncharacterized protein n=1 Tax=Angiostrongylus cantonensis TaxID=6313 RepID=A0A0K0DCY4_ANGCA
MGPLILLSMLTIHSESAFKPVNIFRPTGQISSRHVPKVKRQQTKVRTKFTERSPTSLEADIIVVDNSKQEDENSSICSTQGSLSTTGNVQLERKPEERSSSIAADEISASARPVKKPITFPQHEQFATPSTSTNSFSDKDFNIEIRRDVADFRVVNSPTRKNPSSQKEEAKTPSRSLSYVHKSETLTVIMPKRWVTGVKPDVETQATVLPVKQNDNNKTSDLLKSPAGADKSSVSMRKLKKGSDKLSSGLTVHKDDLQPVSDDDSDCKPNCEIASDLSVVKSVNSGRNIIPFSSEVSLFSNHFPCRQLFIHGQRFFSAEQYYVWTKAKFCKDFRAAATVLCLKDPKAIAEVGNHLKNVDATRWMTYSWKVRMKASMAKNSQEETGREQNTWFSPQLFKTVTIPHHMFRQSRPHNVKAGLALSSVLSNVIVVTFYYANGTEVAIPTYDDYRQDIENHVMLGDFEADG